MAMYRTMRDMPEIDAIRRCDTVRTMREVNWTGPVSADDDDGLDGARGIICWGLLCAVVAGLLAVLL
jgi:hypothetical protein